MTTIVYPIKTITRYHSLPTLAAKYKQAQNVLTVAKRMERSRSIVIIKHKYMLMCNHKIRINIVRRLKNSTVRHEIGQYSEGESPAARSKSVYQQDFAQYFASDRFVYFH